MIIKQEEVFVVDDQFVKFLITEPRRNKNKIGIFDINYVTKRNPWTAAFWAMALPGLGHIHLGLYIKGFILISGEIFLNLTGHINEAILYTMTFQFDKVHQVTNLNWAFLYCSIWVLAIFDSYRVAVELNKYTWFEEKQSVRYFKKGVLEILGINFIEKRTPWMSIFLSATLSGLSHICNNKLISGLTLLGWMIAIAYYTEYPNMIIYTFTGQFERINSIVNYKWLLFFPSIYFFAIFDAYTHTVNYNNLYKEEQKYYLLNKFGKNDFDLV